MGVPGRVLPQLREHAVPQRFIERPRLKAECLQMNVAAAAPPRPYKRTGGGTSMRRYSRPWAVATALLLFALVAGPVAADSRHRVAPGETLWGLAQAYGVSVDALATLNKLADPDLIFVGQLLKVP